MNDLDQQLRDALNQAADQLAIPDDAWHRNQEKVAKAHRVRWRRRAVVGLAAASVVALIAVIATVGLPNSGRSSAPDSVVPLTVPTTPHAVVTQPAPSIPPTPSQPSVSSAPPTPSIPASSAPTSTPSAPVASGRVDITVAGLDTASELVAGGAPLQFTVTITNGTASGLSDVAPLVYLDHCGCTPTGPMPVGASAAGSNNVTPAGTLDYRAAGTDSWLSTRYDYAGLGMDYLYVQQHPAISVPAHGSISIDYRLQLRPASELSPFDSGSVPLIVTLVQPTTPGASIPGIGLTTVPLKLSIGTS